LSQYHSRDSYWRKIKRSFFENQTAGSLRLAV
jgi:hypothetical protein